MRTKTPMTGGDVRLAKPVLIKHTPIGPGRVASVRRWRVDHAPASRHGNEWRSGYILPAEPKRCRPRLRGGQNRVHLLRNDDANE